MPKPGSNEVITQQFRRFFLQQGGPRPNAVLKYAGQDGQYMVMQGVTINDAGDIEKTYVPDPRRFGAYRTAATSKSVPDPHEATLVLLEKHRSIPWFQFQQNCPVNVYEVVGKCNDPSDFNNGWESYVRIYSYGDTSTKELGDISAWDSDEANETSVPLKLAAIYPVGALTFGKKNESSITAEIVDVVYNTQQRCGDCGVPNDGAQFIYALQKGISSPATKPTVFYSVNGGLTWSSVVISTAANAENVVAIEIVGDRLVVVSPTGGASSASALYVSTINQVTGVPSTSFTKVTPSAFTVANTVNDILAISSSEVYFAAQGGYVYKSKDVLSDMSVVSSGDATAQNLSRIHGLNEVIYASGASGAVIKSTNNGQTWSATTTSPGSGTNSALHVLDAYRAWVGNNAGALYYTIDGGETWTQKLFTSQAADAVNDIQFATDEVAIVAFTVSTAAYIATTMNGGERWTDSANTTRRLGSVPAAVRINRVAFPVSGDPAVNVNNVALGGLAAAADGVVMLAATAVV